MLVIASGLCLRGVWCSTSR